MNHVEPGVTDNESHSEKQKWNQAENLECTIAVQPCPRRWLGRRPGQADVKKCPCNEEAGDPFYACSDRHPFADGEANKDTRNGEKAQNESDQHCPRQQEISKKGAKERPCVG